MPRRARPVAILLLRVTTNANWRWPVRPDPSTGMLRIRRGSDDQATDRPPDNLSWFESRCMSMPPPDERGEFYRDVFNKVSDAIFVYDPADGVVVDANPAASELTGYARQSLIGNSVAQFSTGTPTEAEQAADELVEQAARRDQQFEWTVNHADGDVLTTEVTLHRTTLDEADRVLAIMRDITERKRREEELRDLAEEYQSLLTNIDDAIFLIDVEEAETDVEFRYGRINTAHESQTGLKTEEIHGKTPREILGDDIGGEVEANYRRCVEQREPIRYEETLPLPKGELIWETKLAPVVVDGEVVRIVGIARNITERVNREETLRRMYEIGAETSSSFEEKVTRLLEIGHEYLDLPYGFFTAIDQDTQEIVHAIGDHELLQPGEKAPFEETYCRKTIESDDLVAMEDARQGLGAADPAYDRFELGCYVGTKVRVGAELYGTFCFGAADSRDQTFTNGEREIVKLLGQWAGYELERAEYEDRLRDLHRVSQELLVAETADEVARIAVEAGRDVFDLPMGACWRYNANSDALRPLAETREAKQTIGKTPTFERGNALVWESFERGEIRTYADVTEHEGQHNRETALRSEVHVPLGEQGVMIFSSTEARAFDGSDIGSLRLLGALVREAMIAAEREETLANRTEALQRQNEQLEEFASLVAHDLRNPLAGAIGSLEMARETTDDEWFDRTEQSLDRMDALVDELLDIARGNREAVDARDLSLTSIVEEAWSYMDTPDATLRVGDDLGRIHADETRLLQLFGNLFRNSVEHVGKDVTVEIGTLPEGEGFYVADDGPGLSDDSRKAVNEYDAVESVTESGLGLMSVVDIVEAHGWDLSVPETDGGARFEVRTDG
ncbi:MAG: PAS domain S-box protein [Halobacteriales archaeon]